MKQRPLVRDLAAVCCVAILATGCASTRDRLGSVFHRGDRADQTAAATTPATPRTDLSDAQVLAMLATADMNEIEAARMASQKQLPPEVLRYAQHLYSEHADDLSQAQQWSSRSGVAPAMTPQAQQMRDQGQQQLSTLTSLDGRPFAAAYIDAMVKDHEQVLSMIDRQLLPDTDDAALKAQLQAAREHVSQHLQQAKMLQDGLRR